MVLGLGAQVLEDAVLPELLHQGPVLDLAVLDRVAHGVGLGDGDRLVTNEEVEVVDALARSSGRRTGTRALGASRRSLLDADLTGDDVVGLAVASVAHLGVAADGGTSEGERRASAACGDGGGVSDTRGVSRCCCCCCNDAHVPSSIVDDNGGESRAAHDVVVVVVVVGVGVVVWRSEALTVGVAVGRSRESEREGAAATTQRRATERQRGGAAPEAPEDFIGVGFAGPTLVRSLPELCLGFDLLLFSRNSASCPGKHIVSAPLSRSRSLLCSLPHTPDRSDP